jgi:hypothetical protein
VLGGVPPLRKKRRVPLWMQARPRTITCLGLLLLQSLASGIWPPFITSSKVMHGSLKNMSFPEHADDEDAVFEESFTAGLRIPPRPAHIDILLKF